MKRLLLLLLGLVPFPLGWLVNWLMMNGSSRWLPWYGVIFAVIWFFLAYCFFPFAKNLVETVVLLNLPAAVVLILLAVQQIFFHSYWLNAAGAWTQIFYLPLVFLVTNSLWWTPSLLPSYCIAFLLLVAVSLLGCVMRRRRLRKFS